MVKSFSVNFNEAPMAEEDKKTFIIVSMTINPNITNQTDSQRDMFTNASKYFFSESVITKYFNSDEIDTMKIHYQLEKGNIKMSDHMQVAMFSSCAKDNKVIFDMDKVNHFWTGVMGKMDCSKRTCYVSIKSKIDYSKVIKQYVRK